MSKNIAAIIIRIVFIFAYTAFLAASVRHIAFFFHDFEPGNTYWIGSYALAISIDITALVLTISMMFFQKGMPWYSKVFVWSFILGLTGFSWLVDWEYSVQFQGQGLSRATDIPHLNPILASSFAFLNLARSEERRVGEECRSRWAAYQLKKKKIKTSKRTLK